MSGVKDLKTRTRYKITFEDYWSLNKSRLMNSKLTSEEIARRIWNDCFESLLEPRDDKTII